jgi:serine/threonine protein kinase
VPAAWVKSTARGTRSWIAPVAIKILPEAFAADTERIGRFQREAKTLASLNHLNIAHIYGLEESNGVRALVMELVEGEDLAQRIARGAIPVAEALLIARQVADALERRTSKASSIAT